jgi:hypothetical protein
MQKVSDSMAHEEVVAFPVTTSSQLTVVEQQCNNSAGEVAASASREVATAASREVATAASRKVAAAASGEVAAAASGEVAAASTHLDGFSLGSSHEIECHSSDWITSTKLSKQV